MRKTLAPFILFAEKITEAFITGASIAASKASRKRVPTGQKNLGFSHDLSGDGDNEKIVRRTERGK